MPRKFSCRQLRDTGQCFESFLEVRGLDMETDREKLRTIYNQDFKTRYGLAESPAQNRGPSSLPRPSRWGHRSRPGSGGTQLPQWLRPVPGRCRPPLPRGAHAPPAPPGARPLSSGRAHAPSPSGEPPAQPAPPASRARGWVAILRPPAASVGLRGQRWAWGRGETGGGPGVARTRGKSFLLVAASPGAECTGTPAPLLRGSFFRGPLS